LTEIVIESIVTSGAKKAAPKKEVKKAEPKAKAAPKVEVAEAPKVEVKETAPKKAAPKKASGKADDLKKIEGIGPKIAQTLNENGIVTFEDLSKADPKQIAEFIKDVRGNHVPDTWPKQARLAADGKWDEFGS